VLQAAFRDLHGARLHGFALLVALGDRSVAANAAAEALAEGAQRLAELRHPERAAAWLRGRVTRSLAHAGRRSVDTDDERRLALGAIGVTDAAFDGLATLSVRERAAFVAAMIEHMDPIDVETIIGADAGAVHRVVDRARRSYLATAVRGLATEQSRLPAAGATSGLLATRIDAVASRTGLGVGS
jgi:DNA-directed RNA polymerase specialized sigma24 family protein